MKLALLSDIHGNSVALDAVLADIQASGGADAYWILGDLVAFGPDPVGVLERLVDLPQVRFVRGNTDRYASSADRPPPTAAEAAADPTLLHALVEVAGSCAWTQGALTISGWLDWLRQLPLQVEMVLPDGTYCLGLHASPGRDDGPGFAPSMCDATIQASLQGCQADLICTGHTHRPFQRRVGKQHVVNLGSLSVPPAGEWRASYVLLHGDKHGYVVEHRLVDYDREAVIAMLEQQGHPGRAYIIKYLRGLL